MAVIVKQFNVRVGEVSYAAGDVIRSLSEQEEKKLVDQGHCEFPVDVTSAQTTGESVPDPETVEQFIALKSNGQKEFLQKVGVEPGSNETERGNQFTEWLQGKKASTGSNLDPGPNTGLPQ